MTGTVLMKSLMKKPNLKDEYVSDVVCRIVYYDLYFSFNSIFSSLFIIIPLDHTHKLLLRGLLIVILGDTEGKCWYCSIKLR